MTVIRGVRLEVLKNALRMRNVSTVRVAYYEPGALFTRNLKLKLKYLAQMTSPTKWSASIAKNLLGQRKQLLSGNLSMIALCSILIKTGRYFILKVGTAPQNVSYHTTIRMSPYEAVYSRYRL